MRTTQYAMLLVLLFGCSSEQRTVREQQNRKSESKPIGYLDSSVINPYPFTVPSGIVSCEGGAVFFTSNSIKYAINGTAKGRVGPSAKDLVMKIWRDTTSAYGKTKVDIQPVIDMGRKFCD